MENKNLSLWSKNKDFLGVLLFAESLEEGLNHYSYESYRMPSLNLHYLCFDILDTISSIKKKVLMDGNFLPLAEEFEFKILEDIVIKEVMENENIFLRKNKYGDIYDLRKSEIKNKINRYKEIARYIKNACETSDLYFDQIKELLKQNIFFGTYSYENYKNIYLLSRVFLTELINRGYNKKYLFETVNEYFFNNNDIRCIPQTLDDFFEFFTFDAFKYKVIYGISYKESKILGLLKNVEIKTPNGTQKEKLHLQRKNDVIISIECINIDPYSALEDIKDYLNTVLSLHKISQHSCRSFRKKKGQVLKLDKNNNILTSQYLSLPNNPMLRITKRSLYNGTTLLNNVKPPVSFLRAVSLHSCAIEGKVVSNQLLNLWTIIEILIEGKRDNEDRINTICNCLVPVLNRSYIYSQLYQLDKDIRQSEIDLDLFLVDMDNETLDNIEKLAILLSVKDYKLELNHLLSELTKNPLIKYRVEYFSNEVFKDTKAIYDYLINHSNRLRWQIMRIYRNRNMIVHSGVYLPYIEVILENLHFYVDTLFQTLIEYYHIGMTDNESIYLDIMTNEMNYYFSLGVEIDKKKKMKSKQFLKENALTLIFNGYSGDLIKKVTDNGL